MKPPKADIEFLIQEKRRWSEEQFLFENSELPAPEPGSHQHSEEELKHRKEGDFFVDEPLLKDSELLNSSNTDTEDADQLNFDINDSMILPDLKANESEEMPFLLEPTSEGKGDDSGNVEEELDSQSLSQFSFSDEKKSPDSEAELEDLNSDENTLEMEGELADEHSLSSNIGLEGGDGDDEQGDDYSESAELDQEDRKEDSESSEIEQPPPQSNMSLADIAALTGGKRPPLPEVSPLQDYLAKKSSEKNKGRQNKNEPTPHLKSSPQQPTRRQGILSFSALFESNTLVGIDIGCCSVKYVQLKKSARGLRIINFGSFPVPQLDSPERDDENRDLFSDILQKQFKGRSFNNALLTSAVSGLKVLFKNIQVPKAAQKELSKAVPWACRKDLPFPIENTVFEYKLIERKTKNSTEDLDVFVIAAQQELIASHLSILQKASISPSKVSTVPVALWNLYREVLKKDALKCLGVIDIGANSSHIIFIKEGQLEFAREISTGGSDFTEALTGAIFLDGKEINLDAKRAESIKRKYGFPDDTGDKTTKEGIPLNEISALMGPVLERLLSEIQRTVDFFKERFNIDNIDKIYLSGGGALMVNLIDRLSKELEISIDLLNPFDLLSLKKFKENSGLEKMGPRFAVSIGLALDTGKTFNLLPRQLKGSYGFQYLKRVFRYTFMIAILVMVLLSQNVSRQFSKFQARFEQISQQYDSVRPLREKFLSLQNELKSLNTIRAAHKDGLELNLGTANHLKAISHLIPRNITLTSFKISYESRKVEGTKDQHFIQEVLLLTGVAFENNSMEGINLAKFLLNLEKSEYFALISLKSQKIREDGGLEFSVACET